MGTLQSGDVGITTAKQMVRWKEMFQDTIHFLIGLGYYSDFDTCLLVLSVLGIASGTYYGCYFSSKIVR